MEAEHPNRRRDLRRSNRDPRRSNLDSPRRLVHNLARALRWRRSRRRSNQDLRISNWDLNLDSLRRLDLILNLEAERKEEQSGHKEEQLGPRERA